MLLQLLTLVFLKFNLFAQDTERTIMLLNESRVLDTNIYKKNYPALRNWWIKASGSTVSNRAAHISETGLIYSLIFIKGDKNFGDYISKRNELTIMSKGDKEQERIAKENNDNVTQVGLRSSWVQMKKMTVLQPDFKIEDYDFRKVFFYTVPLNKMTEFESLVEQSNEIDKMIGLKYNYIVYKAIDGYAYNTYMVLVPDKSKIDYYKHLEERDAKRAKNKAYMELYEKESQLRNTFRMDHLSRIPN